MIKYAHNCIDLIGDVRSVPTLHLLPSDVRVCTFWLVTHDIIPTPILPGNLHVVEWHRIVAWQRMADICYTRWMVGDFVRIIGRLVTRRWHDTYGTAHYVTEVVAEDLMVLCPAYLSSSDKLIRENSRLDEPYQPPQEPDMVSRHVWSIEWRTEGQPTNGSTGARHVLGKHRDEQAQ